MAEEKAAKQTSAKGASAKEVKPTKKSGPATRTRFVLAQEFVIPDRAAAVEKNIGGSEPLRDFLNKVGW